MWNSIMSIRKQDRSWNNAEVLQNCGGASIITRQRIVDNENERYTRIQATEMKLSRSVKDCGRIDGIRNEYIRTELDIFSSNQKI
jgi:hypothetical protein